MKVGNGFAWLTLAALGLLCLPGCADEDPVAPADTTPPAAVTDLWLQSVSGSQVTLTWTAPGDDGDTGTAAEYDLRFSAEPITAGNWETAIQAADEPVPAVAGTEQSAAVNTEGRADLHFGLKTADEVSNWSGLSNGVTATVEDEPFVVNRLTDGGDNDHPCMNDGRVVWVGPNSEYGTEIYVANLNVAFPMAEVLTDNGGEKWHPSSHGSERIVWQGRGSGSEDWEIWIYDRDHVPRYRQFTDNEMPDRQPQLTGGGSFAWLQGYPSYAEVHYWYEFAHSESVISDGCCNTDTWNNEFLSGADGAAVWRSYERYGGDDGPKTTLWSGSITDLTDVLDANMATNYSLSEGSIAYTYGGGGTQRVKYWDGSTITDVAQGFAPSLHGNRIAYEDWDGQDWEIYFWDGMTIHQITDNDINDTQASLHGDFIAWVGRTNSSTDDIYYVRVE